MSDEQKDELNPPADGKKCTVDPNKCIGCGLCVTTCPDVFGLGDDGKSFVKDASACANCNCQEAMDNCPAHAISWVEETENK